MLSLGIYFTLKYRHVSMSLCGYVHINVDTHGGQRHLTVSQLELEVVVSHLTINTGDPTQVSISKDLQVVIILIH